MNETTDYLLNVDDLPADYDLTKLDDPVELLKFKKKNIKRQFSLNTVDEGYCEPEEVEDFGYTAEEYERMKGTTISGLLNSEIQGIKLNSIEGLGFFFSQLFDRLLLAVRELKGIHNCLLSEIHEMYIDGSVAYIESDDELISRIKGVIKTKKAKMAADARKREEALQTLKAAGFALDADGSIKKIKKTKKTKNEPVD